MEKNKYFYFLNLKKKLFYFQVDKNKLLQTEFPIIEFDPETFQVLLDYLHSGISTWLSWLISTWLSLAYHHMA